MLTEHYITIIVHTLIIIANTINKCYITEICEQKLLANLAYIFLTRTVFCSQWLFVYMFS